MTEVRGNKQSKLFKGQTLVAVPSNVGPATMPNYENLATQGIYTDPERGIRVFAGQRAETFYIDLGAVFDTANLRRSPPVLSALEDADDTRDPFGVNRFSGFNINTMAIEVPITRITEDRKPVDTTDTPIIGMYASTSRQRRTILNDKGQPRTEGEFMQASRMGNPLVNELIIDTPSKDRWNATDPADEAKFQGF